ncbi:molecular chaperone [Pseudomonas sp. 9.1(2019)]|uniref:fimbrial biogenesis chaperone n=1 Tax=Pseudomonas sp. 9.1(2019) TaxID=2580568 RepID=UPI00137193C7|nr:molecular chaperone [Pseudomonas sp. 9.1(2019)]NBG90963.1 molecular chaperone [Pseudomonas sp. 9.1(2019)]
MQAANAGIILGGTRLIYAGDTNEASISIRNSDKNNDYLIQSWLDNDDEKNSAKVPFVVTPPLFRLDRESDNILRIAKVGGNLPSDRETLYWLSVRSIGATPKEITGSSLQLVLRTRIKFIYRPSSLNNDAALNAYRSLSFIRQDGELVVKNPTPYYVTLATLKVGGKDVEEPGMVSPYGELRVKVSGSGAIEWQSINDYGGLSQTARQ